MKIKLKKDDDIFYYDVIENDYTQEQFDYIFQYLYFGELSQDCYIIFNNRKTEKWFKKTYINSIYLESIYYKSFKGYEWLEQNWSNGFYRLFVNYTDKQELKTIVNKVINVELIRM